VTTEPLTDRGRRTRDALLAAARTTFEAKGFNATRMGDIADAAGVSHGTVYTWFDSKDAMLRALVEQLVQEVRESIRVPEVDDPAARVRQANDRYLAAYRQYARLMQVVEEVATTDPWFRSALAEMRTAHVSRVAREIERLQRDGQAAADLDPMVSAAALCAMVEGFGRHWLGRGEPHDEQLAATTLTTLWVRALSPVPVPRTGGSS
jgi:AcrR family transcriptional regulator